MPVQACAVAAALRRLTPLNAIWSTSPLIPTVPADVATVAERVGAHSAVEQRPWANHPAGFTCGTCTRRWSSGSLKRAKGRSVGAAFGFGANPAPFGRDASLGLSDGDLIPGHGELRQDRGADPLQPRALAYRVDLGEEFVGQEK
jgi:hypothetical protein